MATNSMSEHEMVEVNLEGDTRDEASAYGSNMQDKQPEEQAARRLARPAMHKSVRYYVVLFALISPFVVSFSKAIITMAIIDMIDPASVARPASHPEPEVATDQTERVPIFEVDNSCPVSGDDRRRLLEEFDRARHSNSSSNKSENNDRVEPRPTGQRDRQEEEGTASQRPTTTSDKFGWDSDLQGLLKAAYSIGHAPLQISGGRLSEIYGSRWVMGVGAAAIGTCCLLAPLLAHVSFYLLFADLVLMGVFGSFMTPSIFTLFARWLTPGEKCQFVAFYLVASRLGFGLSSLICGQMFGAGYSWRHVYFTAGAFAAVYALAFMLLVRSHPQEHPLISRLEVDYLAWKNPLVASQLADGSGGDQCQHQRAPSKLASKKGAAAAPWAAILCSAPVWAFVVTKFCVKLAGDAIALELPTYLERVMHYPADTNGLVNSANYAIFCLGSTLVGFLAKRLIKRPPFAMSKTAIRKSFQSLASFVVSLGLLAMSLSVCNRWITQLSLLLVMFFTTFGAGGEIQSPLDLSVRYSGTLHAMASTVAITGVIEPIFVGVFMKGRQADQNNWKRIWMGASAISFLGGLVFLLFADATVQPFDEIPVTERQDEKDNDDSNNRKIRNIINSTRPATGAQPEDRRHQHNGATSTVNGSRRASGAGSAGGLASLAARNSALRRQWLTDMSSPAAATQTDTTTNTGVTTFSGPAPAREFPVVVTSRADHTDQHRPCGAPDQHDGASKANDSQPGVKAVPAQPQQPHHPQQRQQQVNQRPRQHSADGASVIRL